MRIVSFAGGCNAEAIANAIAPIYLPGAFLYRVPGAVWLSAAKPAWADIYSGSDENIIRRINFEAKTNLLERFFSAQSDIIVLDFWRDIYIPICEFQGSFFSVALEYQSDPALFRSLLSLPGYIAPMTREHFLVTDKFLDILCREIRNRGIQCAIYACHPVERVCVNDEYARKTGDFSRYEVMFPRYQELVRAFMENVPGTILLHPDAEKVYSSDDAPWGEGCLHLAPRWYLDEGLRLIAQLKSHPPSVP